jgi:hypothetical protein
MASSMTSDAVEIRNLPSVRGTPPSQSTATFSSVPVGLTQNVADAAPPGVQSQVVVRAIVNATLTPRYDQLTLERNQLVHVQIERELTACERRRLTYLRWQLDQIEDAVGGAYLDSLDALVAKHEVTARQITALMERLTDSSKSVFKPRRSRRR